MSPRARRAASRGRARWPASPPAAAVGALDEAVEFALEAVERGIEEFAAWDDDKVEAEIWFLVSKKLSN